MKQKRLINHGLQSLLLLALLVLMPLGVWAQGELYYYGITVGGVEVTNWNADAISGDNIEGIVTYDAQSNTLTLNGATIKNYSGITCLNDLTILCLGESVVTGDIKSTSANGATLTLQYGDVDIPASLQYSPDMGGNASGFTSVVYDGLYLSADNPRTLKFSASRQRFEDSEGAWASTIKFSNAKTYELWLGGTKVTESNKDNILGDWGSATFDPDENLLTLNDMTLTGTGITTDGIISRLPNLTISVNGDNTITCKDTCSVIRADMEGEQTLTIQKGSDGCSLTLDGSRVIRDFNTFTATGLSWNDSFTYKYDETLTNFSAGYRLMKADGEEASRNFAIGFKPALYDSSVTPYDLWVAGVQVTSANAEDIFYGTVSFDAANNVLTLKNATINLADVYNGIAVASGIANLTINLVGNNTVTPHVNTPFFAMYTGEIGTTAPTLTFNTDYYLDDGIYWLGSLKVNNITETSALTDGYTIANTLEESPESVAPENAGSATTGWKYSVGTTASYVKVWKLEAFDLWLDGNRVLSSNLGAGLSNGPKYNPVTERLVLSKNMVTDVPVMSSMADLTVEITGACSITPETSSPAIYFQEKGEVTSGSLTFVRGDATTASLTLTANGENQSQEPYKAIEGYSASNIHFGEDLALTSHTTMTEALAATTVTFGGATYYDLKVGGVYVSQANADDVLGDGTVTFTMSGGQEAATYTLTLNGATLTQPVIIGLPNLTIDIQGTNSITTEEMCIQKMENTAPAVIFTSTSDVVGTLTLKSDAGVNNVGAYNVGSFTISDELALVLKNYGKLSSNQYYFTDGSSTTEAKFSPYYGVTVGAMQICPDNAADVIGDGIGDGDESGMVSFDKDNSILTLNNASLSGIIRSSLPDLTIELVGNNSIYSVGDRILQAGSPVNMTIQSSAAVKGSLSMHKGYSSSEKGNFVDDNVTLTISAPLAVISGSLTSDEASNDYYATIGEAYNLWVGGTQVTVANADDILAEFFGADHPGMTMTFDAENNLLTVGKLGEEFPFGIESQLDALTIKFSGESKIYSESGAAISYTGKGAGALTLVKDATATICSLEFQSFVNNQTAISGFSSLSYDGLYVHSEASDVAYDTNTKTLVDATGAPVDDVKFSTVETYYDLWYYVGDDRIQVTNLNQNDITGDENTQGDPQVTFSYDPESKRNTLTLNGATLAGYFETSISPLYINLIGSNDATEAGAFLSYYGDLDDADVIFTTTSDSPTTLRYNAMQRVTASYENGLALIQPATDNQPAIVGNSFGIIVETADAVHYVTSLNYKNVLEEVGAIPSVQYDGHSRLVLNNATLAGITLGANHNLPESGLEIYLEGNNTITNNDGYAVESANAAASVKLAFLTGGDAPGMLTYTNGGEASENVFPGFDVSYRNNLARTTEANVTTVKTPLQLIVDEVASTAQTTTTSISYSEPATEDEPVTTNALKNLIVRNVLYTLNDLGTAESPDGYDQTNKLLVINSTMTDAQVQQVHEKVISGECHPSLPSMGGQPSFEDYFKGLTFMVPAGEGVIGINSETAEGFEFHLKIGGQPAIKVKKTNITYFIHYSVTENSFVYLYLVATGTSAPAYAQSNDGRRIGPKSTVSGGLGGLNVTSNSISSAPDAGASYLMMSSGDFGSVSGSRGIRVNNSDVTDLPVSAFASAFSVSPAPRRAPDDNVKTFIDASNTKITGKSFSRTEGAFKDVPEETIIYLPAGNTAVGKNFVIGGICENLELKATRENPFEAAADFTAAVATFDREFTEGEVGTEKKCYTIFLPYALNIEEVDGELWEYTGYDSANETVKMTQVVATSGNQGWTTPNKVYFFKPSKTGALKPMLSTQVKKFTGAVAEPGNESEAEGMHGVYEYYKWTTKPSNVYCYSASDKDGIVAGEFAKVGVDTYIKPFRAYLRLNASTAPEFISISWGDGTTSIVPLDKEQVHQDADGWYTITGFRLPSKPTEKGIYIHNHKKIVVK